ncbi:MAG: VirK/YbjX family protein [Firmicutes bacterium]|nr:VirK/YbjX family protein [Bacillota bacterium]
MKQNLRWTLIAAAHPKAALRWFAAMESQALEPFAEANPLLPLKPLRVYLSSRWGLKKRAKVMEETYQYAHWKGGPVRKALLKADAEGVRLAQWSLGENGEAELRLGFDNRFRKEGEFAVSLWCPALGGRIASASFALEWREIGLTMLVGCVQGIPETESGLMKGLQKAMHGLRPKALVIFAAQELGRSLGIREILGAGNAIQVHRHKHLIHLDWAHDLSFDYDGLWSEMGGTPVEEGWFHLPRKAKRRTRDEIKPNKRSQYAKRYALMDELAMQIRAAMATPDERVS